MPLTHRPHAAHMPITCSSNAAHAASHAPLARPSHAADLPLVRRSHAAHVSHMPLAHGPSAAHMPSMCRSHAAQVPVTCRSHAAHMPPTPRSHAAHVQLIRQADVAHALLARRPRAAIRSLVAHVGTRTVVEAERRSGDAQQDSFRHAWRARRSRGQTWNRSRSLPCLRWIGVQSTWKCAEQRLGRMEWASRGCVARHEHVWWGSIARPGRQKVQVEHWYGEFVVHLWRSHSRVILKM